MRSSRKKAMRRRKGGKRSRAAAVRAIGRKEPTVEERKAIAEGRRDYKRGDFVAVGRTEHKLIQSRRRVVAGEPVVKGTRIPARLIADFVHQGVSRGTIRREYDPTNEQSEPAVLFDRVTPRRARRPVRKLDVKTYFAERA